jgi:predicted lysophospholipase L1 biosynthesis ABC-type transport system permease subunit
MKTESDTPETDEEEIQRGGDEHHHDYVKADFARKLERDRDSMKRQRDFTTKLLAQTGKKLASAHVVAVNAINELERLLATGDTYALRGIIDNLKCFLNQEMKDPKE